jgi:hypothetical protein
MPDSNRTPAKTESAQPDFSHSLLEFCAMDGDISDIRLGFGEDSTMTPCGKKADIPTELVYAFAAIVVTLSLSAPVAAESPEPKNRSLAHLHYRADQRETQESRCQTMSTI